MADKKNKNTVTDTEQVEETTRAAEEQVEETPVEEAPAPEEQETQE